MRRLNRPTTARPLGNGQQLTANGYIISADTDAEAWDAADEAADARQEARAKARQALDAAAAQAAWRARTASAATPTGSHAASRPTPTVSPGEATRTEAPSIPRPIARNTPPATVWEALRRLLGCNRQELAARLGVSRHTLQRWERGEPTQAGAQRVADLMQQTLAAAGAGWTVAQPGSEPTRARLAAGQDAKLSG